MDSYKEAKMISFEKICGFFYTSRYHYHLSIPTKRPE